MTNNIDDILMHAHIKLNIGTSWPMAYVGTKFPEFLILEYYRTGSSVEYVQILALFGTE